MDNPDSPNSIGSDQLTVDLLSPRSKRRRVVQNDVDDRRDLVATPDVSSKNNNNDVSFVLMEDENQENGDDDGEVRILWP